MVVTLKNIQESTNILTKATLYSGVNAIAKIPIDLSITVKNTPNIASCTGKTNKTLCLGGMCCDEKCRVGADCCTTNDCTAANEECSSSFKCVASVIPGECEGKNDSTACQTGVCCSQECVECCSDSDCSTGEVCTSYNTCEAETPNECKGKTDNASCTDGVCCDEYCITGGECCAKEDCPTGKTCSSSNYCVTSGNGGDGGGIDFVTIGLIAGGVAAAGIAAYFLLKKFRKKGGEGDQELDSGEESEEEFSDEDFY
jgi:hypothetical protein